MVLFIDGDEAQGVSHFCWRNVHTKFFRKNILTLFSQVTTCPSNFADLFNNSHVAGLKIKAKSSNVTYRPLGFERMSATFKVANTPFHMQSDDITILR